MVALPRDIGLALLGGVVVAGAITALVPANQWHVYLGGGIGSILLAMVLGAADLRLRLGLGADRGGVDALGGVAGRGVGVFDCGPATNAATLATVWKLLGRRSAALYLLTVAVSAVVGGLVLDWLFTAFHTVAPFLAEQSHGPTPGSWWSTAWAVLLLAVFAWSYGARPRAERHR